MSKQLKLRAVRDYCLAAARESKPLNLDEDNVASQYKDTDGWTIHRKRAWMALMCGAHYDYIDFSIINYCETGTEESQRCIRTWFRHLSRFIHSLDLAAAHPLPGVVTAAPEHTVEAAFGVAGSDVSVYLADERELGVPGAGEPIRGALTLSLPEGQHSVSCMSPEAGQWSPDITITGGSATTVALPDFRHDILVRVQASDAGS
jgi:hypothetical protein